MTVEREPIQPLDPTATVLPDDAATPEKPKGFPPMKVWFLKAIAEDEGIQMALATLIRENAEVRQAIRVICIEDILTVADKVPVVESRDAATEFLTMAKKYIRPEALRQPYSL